MPKLMRQVEAEVDVTELNSELAQFASEVKQDGAYLTTQDGQRGDKVKAGDNLIPNEATYAAGVVAPETHVHVIKTIDEAGIIWGAFYAPDGNKRMQFFVPGAFVAKYEPAPNPLAKSAKTADAPKRTRR